MLQELFEGGYPQTFMARGLSLTNLGFDSFGEVLVPFLATVLGNPTSAALPGFRDCGSSKPSGSRACPLAFPRFPPPPAPPRAPQKARSGAGMALMAREGSASQRNYETNMELSPNCFLQHFEFQGRGDKL